MRHCERGVSQPARRARPTARRRSGSGFSRRRDLSAAQAVRIPRIYVAGRRFGPYCSNKYLTDWFAAMRPERSPGIERFCSMSSQTTVDQRTAATPPASRSGTPATRPVFWAIFPSIMLPMFLAVIDQTIVATALPAIASSLGEVQWIQISPGSSAPLWSRVRTQ